MEKITKSCTDHNNWLFNLFFINNFTYNFKFDEFVKGIYSQRLSGQNVEPVVQEQKDICLPFTWGMAVYMQLSLLLPIALLLYTRYPKQAKMLHVGLITTSMLKKYLAIH